MRKRTRNVLRIIAGKPVMPSCGLRGGVSKAINEDERKTIIEAGEYGIEMAFRAYDPCHACATYSLPGRMPLEINVYDSKGDWGRKLKSGE